MSQLKDLIKERDRLAAECAAKDARIKELEEELEDKTSEAFSWCELARGYEAERDALKAAILDIDAHATGYGLLNPDDPAGSPAAYLISVGCLHRALGLVGHCAAKAESTEREPFTKEMVQECLRRGAIGANELLKQLEEDRRRGAWENGKRFL